MTICCSCGASFQPIRSGRQLYCSDRCRFLSMVDKKPGYGPDGQCWLWTGTVHGKGYGHFRLGDRVQKAHRAALILLQGRDPGGSHACHSCDMPACVNPEHVFLGSNTDNLMDRQNKGRQARGVRHSRAKLAERDIFKVRSSQGSHREIAEQFGVTKSTITHILARKTWTHI